MPKNYSLNIMHATCFNAAIARDSSFIPEMGRRQTASAGCVAEGSMQRRGHGLDSAEEAIADVAGGGWWGGGAVS